MTKFKYDNKPQESSKTLGIEETSDVLYVNLKSQSLNVGDTCELIVIDSNDNIVIKRDLPRNFEDGIFTDGDYFVHQLKTDDVKLLDKGRFELSLRIYNDSMSKIVVKTNLKIA